MYSVLLLLEELQDSVLSGDEDQRERKAELREESFTLLGLTNDDLSTIRFFC